MPIVQILTSKAVWACFVGHFAGDWGAYAMSNALPTYFKKVLGLDPTSVSFYYNFYFYFFKQIFLDGNAISNSVHCLFYYDQC